MNFHILTHHKHRVCNNWKLAYPIMVSQLVHILVGVTDSIMVGHIGVESLAAAALGNIIFSIIFLTGVGVSIAVTPVVAAAKGVGDHEAIGEALRHSLAINLCTALLLTVFGLWGKEVLLYMGQPETVVQLAIPYLAILSWSIIPLLIFQTFRQFAEGLSDTKTTMLIMLLGLMFNVLFNYVLIYGHWGFPMMGLEGAGWGSLAARILIAVALGLYIYKKKSFRRYRSGFGVGGYSRRMCYDMLKIGLPAGGQFAFEVTAFEFSAIMMGWIGTHALAAHQIAITMVSMSYMTTRGIASVATIRVGYAYGQRKISMLRREAHTILLMTFAFTLVWSAFFMLTSHFIPALYTTDQAVIITASSLMVIAGFFQVSDGMQVACVGVLHGMQDVKVPLFRIFLAYWVIGLPLGYGLAFYFQMGAIGVWCGLLVGLTIAAIALWSRVETLSKKMLILQR